ncbi:MAG TPA: polysaccharide deacetylase family protein [Candidatus Eisenbacteria bacterium]|nr:polysaccharide deacetylase family protein [Candidatus Eisenbacteria bacterium]
MSRPEATVSVDVDPVDLHLAGYGVRGVPPDPLVYQRALPRLRERLRAAGVRATFFVVARDVVAHAPALRSLVEDGHEIASHTVTHPLALTRLPDAALDAELVGSRRALEQALGLTVVGFRAPNFDVDARVLARVAAAGYRYDASDYPSPVLVAARLALAAASARPGEVLRMRLLPRSLARRPGRVATGAGELTEFPLSVTPGVRLPVYHTLRYMTAPDAFRARLDGFARRGEPLSYPLHAVDALGAREDRVDARLARHPGMALPLADKLAMLDDVLQSIARRFDARPFAERVAGNGPAPAGV